MKKFIFKLFVLSLYSVLLHNYSFAQTNELEINENSTVSIFNRTAQVRADGSWIIPNIPTGFGNVKARATCIENGLTISGESAPFNTVQDRMNAVVPIILNQASPIPDSITISSPTTNLSTEGETAQLTVTANFPDSTSGDVTPESQGTNYTTSNPNVAIISDDGLVTAVSSGLVIISALNEGALGLIKAKRGRSEKGSYLNN